MQGHDFWHVLVLGSTILGAAGGLMLMLAPLLFDEIPIGLSRARPVVIGLVGAAALLLLWEWWVVH